MKTKANKESKNMKAFTGFACLSILSCGFALAAGNETFTFPNGRQVGQIDKVACQLKVSGDFKHIAEQDKKEHVNKMLVDCKLAYDEKILEVASNSKSVSRSARYYEKAEGMVKNGDQGMKPALRDERRLIGAVVGDQSPLLFSPTGPLNEDELELIVILGNSLLLDRLLPEKPVAVGDAWNPSEQFMAHFLSLDEVGQSDVQCTLKEATDTVARFEMSGRVSGIVESVATEIEVKARYRYDRRRNRLDWIGLLVKEKRNPSPVTDGFDVAAQLQVTLIPQTASPELTESKLKGISFQPTPELLQLEHRAKTGGWVLTYDRCWKLIPDAVDRADLHLFDGVEHVTQCNLSTLPKADPAKLVALDAYQQELRTALDKDFGEFIKASESATSAKYRLLRVEIRGTVSELPMRWIYYHIADQQGRQAVFVFVVEEKNYERLADRDKTLVNSFRFAESLK
jgi:hypothetical protein